MLCFAIKLNVYFCTDDFYFIAPDHGRDLESNGSELNHGKVPLRVSTVMALKGTKYFCTKYCVKSNHIEPLLFLNILGSTLRYLISENLAWDMKFMIK